VSEAASAADASPGWRYYLQRPVVIIFFLGFSGGLPFPLVYSTLTGWLEDANIQRSTISTFAWLGFAYSFKFLWSPLVDNVKLPLLSRWLGHRRAWLLASQVALGACLFSLSVIDPSLEMTAFALIAICVAFLSATQDIVIDAFRIESAEKEMQSVLAAAYQYGYRLAVVVAMAGALYIAQFASWTAAYKAMAACMAVGIITTLLCSEPKGRSGLSAKLTGNFAEQAGQWIFIAVIEPFADFVKRYRHWSLLLLAYIASFLISDRVLGILSTPFYLDIGFSKAEIATVAKLYGTWVSLIGIGAGAAAVIKWGMSRCIVLASVLIVTTNLFFATMAYAGPRIELLTLTISFDNFAAGFGSTIMIAFMSSLVNVKFTATQYALLSSVSTFFGKLFAGFSGDVQLAIGWLNFFLYAAATGIPAIALGIIVAKQYGKIMQSDESG
jgi:PAT family beta-lactamase induction signal transducer AmpG